MKIMTVDSQPFSHSLTHLFMPECSHQSQGTTP